MRLARLQSFALSLPHTTFVKQWGECLVHKVAGKMFLILVLDGDTVEGVIFKCTPEEFDALTEIDGIIQAPYCAKRMWAKVADLAALPEPELNARIQRSYDLVVAGLPKKTRAALGSPPSSGKEVKREVRGDREAKAQSTGKAPRPSRPPR
jgi:predicted DNA-binding protein (MmcQ/YjbR family)